MAFTTFYVLNGLLNGEKGVRAKTCGVGLQLADGHYYLSEDSTDGVGPYPSRDEAIEAWHRSELTQLWAFPLDHGSPYRLKNEEAGPGDGTNIATITRDEPNGTLFTVTPEGWYERLDLTMTAGAFSSVAHVYAALIRASSKVQ